MLGSLVLRCFQNLMDLFWMFRRRGYWPNSALHPLFGVFLWTLSILLQKSKCRVFLQKAAAAAIKIIPVWILIANWSLFRFLSLLI